MKTAFMRHCVTMFFCILSWQALAVAEFKIITLQHRLAEDILSSIKPFMQQDGTVTAMQNHLIIRTSSDNMAEIEKIIASLDVVRQNFKITVSQHSNLETTNNDITLSGQKQFGKLGISNGKHSNKRNAGAQISISDTQTDTQGSSRQFINVADGERAFILVGQSIPFTQEWVTLTQRYVSVQRTTEFVNISTGFSVWARSIGNQIELEVTPSIAQLNQNSVVDFVQLSSIIRIKQGQWLDLSGIMQKNDEVSRTILSYKSSQSTQNTQLQIRVE